MIEIKIFMNSTVEDVFSFKTCCGLKAEDQNLEIHITNKGHEPVVMNSYFDLVGAGFKKRIDNLMPQGPQTIEPGEIKGFYCYMDQGMWDKALTLIFFDSDQKHYETTIRA